MNFHEEKHMNRRSFILRLALPVSMASSMALSLTSCGGSDSDVSEKKSQSSSDCEDLSGLSESERMARDSFGYEVQAALPERSCTHCKLFIPAGKTSPCAGCLLFKGPVKPEGSCIQFAPKES